VSHCGSVCPSVSKVLYTMPAVASLAVPRAADFLVLYFFRHSTFVLHVSKLCEFLFWPCMYVTTLQTVASPKLLLPLFKISVSCRITYNNMRMWHMKKSHEMISAE